MYSEVIIGIGNVVFYAARVLTGDISTSREAAKQSDLFRRIYDFFFLKKKLASTAGAFCVGVKRSISHPCHYIRLRLVAVSKFGTRSIIELTPTASTHI